MLLASSREHCSTGEVGTNQAEKGKEGAKGSVAYEREACHRFVAQVALSSLPMAAILGNRLEHC